MTNQPVSIALSPVFLVAFSRKQAGRQGRAALVCIHLFRPNPMWFGDVGYTDHLHTSVVIVGDPTAGRRAWQRRGPASYVESHAQRRKKKAACSKPGKGSVVGAVGFLPFK